MTEPKRRGPVAAERREFGQRLKRTAQAVGYTSESLSEALGVTPGAVRNWWVGKNEPSRETLAAYARLTNVSVGYLIEGDKPMGHSGSLQEWRLRFTELIAQGMEPLEAIDRITGLPHWNTSGIPDERLTPEERELLGAPGASEAMRKVLEEESEGKWESLAPEDQEMILRLIVKLAPDKGEPTP